MRGTTETERNEAITCKIHGNINYRQGDYEEALLFYDKGLKFDPDNPDLWNNKGLAMVKLGRMDEARKCKMQLKRLEEQSAAEQPAFIANTADSAEKPTHCTVKIKGVSQDTPVQDPPGQVSPGAGEDVRTSDLHFRDLEQNIESIESGLNQVRLGRIEEAKQCKIQIREMEERIELTRQGLNSVKKDRIEEAKKIRKIEEHIDLTKKGLQQLKQGRMEEAKQYKEQLNTIEENIELTRKNLKQVRPPGLAVTEVINPQEQSGTVTPVPHVAAVKGEESTEQIRDIEDIIGLHHEVDQPVTSRRIRLASILLVFFVVLLLGYFTFFK